MSSNPIKVGDVVMLKSGGPLMTVAYILDAVSAKVNWFSPEGYSFSEVMALEALEKKR